MIVVRQNPEIFKIILYGLYDSSNKKSAKILDKSLRYLAMTITIFTLICFLFKTSNF